MASERRAQVTTFILVGIIATAAIVLFFAMADDLNDDFIIEPRNNTEYAPVEAQEPLNTTPQNSTPTPPAPEPSPETDCPTAWVDVSDALPSDAHYNLSMRWRTDGRPELKMTGDGTEQDGVKCEIIFGGDHRDELIMPWLGYPHRPASHGTIIFSNSGTMGAIVALESRREPATFTGWRIHYSPTGTGGGSPGSAVCWGLSDRNYNDVVAEIPIFTHPYCTAARCDSNADCQFHYVCTSLNASIPYSMCLNDVP